MILNKFNSIYMYIYEVLSIYLNKIYVFLINFYYKNTKFIYNFVFFREFNI